MDFNEKNLNYSRHDGESLIAVAKKPSRVRTVFLGSTFDDLREYLKRVRASIREAGLFCSNEDWVTTYNPTVEECRQRLDESDCYIGIFAYWYGSVPPEYQQSITHLEFLWAKEKWCEPPPPMAIFMPAKSSEAEDCLKQKALEVMLERAVNREEHDSVLEKFHQEVDNKTEQWRMVTRFEDLIELCSRIAIICNRWAGLTPMAAAIKDVTITEKNDFERKVSDEELGLLGREKQLVDLKTTINRLPAFRDVPAAAFLVSGKEDDGQEEFLARIVRKKRIAGRPTTKGRPQVEQYGLDALIKCVGDNLGVLNDKEAGSVEDLAKLIHEELQNQQLSTILDEIHGYIGGVTAFYGDFWTPLYKELEKLQAQKKTTNRLIMLIVDYSGKSKQWTSIISKCGGKITQADYSKLFLLQLTDITETDIFNWFEEMEIPFENRDNLAKIALKDPGGKTDGTPQQVFRRLRKQNLWNE